MVHRVIASYNRLGVAAVSTAGKGGRRRQYMTWEEEQAFLAPFFSRAERGERGLKTLALLRSEEHTSELQSRGHLVCRLLLEKKNHELLEQPETIIEDAPVLFP